MPLSANGLFLFSLSLLASVRHQKCFPNSCDHLHGGKNRRNQKLVHMAPTMKLVIEVDLHSRGCLHEKTRTGASFIPG